MVEDDGDKEADGTSMRHKKSFVKWSVRIHVLDRLGLLKLQRLTYSNDSGVIGSGLYRISVTRFGEISPLWHNVLTLGKFLRFFCFLQNFNHTLFKNVSLVVIITVNGKIL